MRAIGRILSNLLALAGLLVLGVNVAGEISAIQASQANTLAIGLLLSAIFIRLGVLISRLEENLSA